MDQNDLALFRQIGDWAEAADRLPDGDAASRSSSTSPTSRCTVTSPSFAYHQRGAVAYVVELWDSVQPARHGAANRSSCSYYTAPRRATTVELAPAGTGRERAAALRAPWRRRAPPQLGRGRGIGGLDPRYRHVEPAARELGEMCRAQSAAFLRVAAMAPAAVADRRASARQRGSTA